MSLAKLLQFVRKLVEKVGIGGNQSRANVHDYKDITSASATDDKSPATSEVLSVSERRAETPVGRGGDSHKNVSEIQYHDLRYLENQFHTHEEPTVLVRKHAVLISLNPLRAIITADRMMLIVPDGADSLLYMLHDYMHGIVEDTDGSYDPATGMGAEIRAYKALFSTITAIHQQEYLSVCAKVERALSKFQSMKTITVELQEAIRVLKNTVSSQGIKVAAYQRLIRDLLSNAEDLALMNLSVLKEDQTLYSKPLAPEILNCKDDVADLLESYLLDYNTLGTKLEFLRAQIQNTDELVSFRLDTFRNDLLIADVTLAIVMISLTVGTYVTNIVGMNLDNGIGDEDPLLFWLLSSGLVVMMVLIFWFLSSRYKLTGNVPVVDHRSRQGKDWW
jgi:predicted DNA binding CopG/RHH family protein